MSKNILMHLRTLYRNKIEDTTKEWEETGELEPRSHKSNLIVMIDLPFWNRVIFLLNNRMKYNLTNFQCRVIRHNFIDNEEN